MVEARCKRVVNRTLEMLLVAGTPRYGESGQLFGNLSGTAEVKLSSHV